MVENDQKMSHLNFQSKKLHFKNDQKFIKNAKKVHFGEACGQIVLPDRLVLVGQKLVENAKFQMRHFE